MFLNDDLRNCWGDDRARIKPLSGSPGNEALRKLARELVYASGGYSLREKLGARDPAIIRRDQIRLIRGSLLGH
jgi:hypothetical protein